MNRRKNNFQQLGFRKSSPSATGLHACDAFVSVTNVYGLEKGIYRYDAEAHQLYLAKEGMTDQELMFYVCDQFWVEGIAAGIFIMLDMRLVWAKDKNVRALPVAYLEAGHFSQTIQLCATSLGLKTWITGSFRDDEISKDFRINSSYISPVAFVGFGHGTDSSIPLEFIKE